MEYIGSEEEEDARLERLEHIKREREFYAEWKKYSERRQKELDEERRDLELEVIERRRKDGESDKSYAERMLDVDRRSGERFQRWVDSEERADKEREELLQDRSEYFRDLDWIRNKETKEQLEEIKRRGRRDE